MYWLSPDVEVQKYILEVCESVHSFLLEEFQNEMFIELFHCSCPRELKVSVCHLEIHVW